MTIHEIMRDLQQLVVEQGETIGMYFMSYV